MNAISRKNHSRATTLISLAFALLISWHRPLAADSGATTSSGPVSIVQPANGSLLKAWPVPVALTLAPGVDISQVLVSLNGRDITAILAPTGGCQSSQCLFSASLLARDAVQPGANTLSARYTSAAGESQMFKSTFTLQVATGPTADPGPDQIVQTGSTVYLNGFRSTGMNLAYAWTITAPPTSSVKTVTATAIPQLSTFQPDVPGNYVVDLTVGDGTTSSVAAQMLVYAETTLENIPVSTRSLCGGCDASNGANYFSQVNGNRYSFAGSTGAITAGVNVVILNRGTLAPLGAKFFTASSDAISFINTTAPDDNELLIIASSSAGSGFPINDLKTVFDTFGSTGNFDNDGATNQPFSFIGVHGMQKSQGWEISGGAGTLAGSLVQDSQRHYTFVQYGYIRYEATPSTGAAPAIVKVGEQIYTSATPAAGNGGFFLVVLQRDTLALVSQKSYETFGTDGDENLQALQTQITALTPNQFSTIIFLVSYGAPHNGPDLSAADHSDYVNVALTVTAQMAGTLVTFADLNITDTYSLVSWWDFNAAVRRGDEASSQISPQLPAGSLTGYLGRGKQGNFYAPIASAIAADSNLDLYEIISQAPRNWPLPITARQQNAYGYMSEALCVCENLRAGYSDSNISISGWEVQLSVLVNPYPGNDPGSPFGDAEFNAVKSQLITEMTYVGHIQNLNHNVEGLWTDQQVNFGLLVDGVTANVKKAISPPPADPLKGAETIAIKLLFAVGSKLASEVPGGSEAVGLLQSVLSVTGVLGNDPQGNSATVDVATTVAGLETSTAYGFTQQLTSLGSLFNLVFQDWGKVQTLGHDLSDLSNPGWIWNGSKTTGQLLNVMTYAMETSLYQSLLPSAAAVGYIDDYFSKPAEFCKKNDTECYFPLAGITTWTTVPLWTADTSGNVENELRFALALDNKGLPTFNPPQGDVLNHLLSPIQSGGLQIYAPDIYYHWPLKQYKCVGAYTAEANCQQFFQIGY